MGFGGPVWHASVRTTSGIVAAGLAAVALRGVGDPALGEWPSRGPTAFHIRRRLTPDEMALAGISAVRDIRGTPEEQARLQALIAEAPYLRGLLPLR